MDSSNLKTIRLLKKNPQMLSENLMEGKFLEVFVFFKVSAFAFQRKENNSYISSREPNNDDTPIEGERDYDKLATAQTGLKKKIWPG